MRPLPGMQVIAEFPTRFDAELAVAQLHDCGLQSTVLSGEFAWPHDLVERRFRLVVREEVADDASAVLSGGRPPDREADALDALYHLRRFSDRPAWVRWATWAALVAIAGPVALLAATEAVFLVERLFP